MREWWKLGLMLISLGLCPGPVVAQIGSEVAVPQHLQDGEEFKISLQKLIKHGAKLFTANWTTQEGGGRPLTKGTGAPPWRIKMIRLSSRETTTASPHRTPIHVPGATTHPS